MRPHSVKFAVIALALVGCASPAQQDLDAARETFDHAVPGDYSFVWHMGCGLCRPGDVTRDVRIVVEGDEIAAATYVDDGTEISTATSTILETIDGVFGTIQTAIDEDAFSVDVVYDAALGYPREIFIVTDRNEGDPDSLFLRDLQPTN